MNLMNFTKTINTLPLTPRMPVLFVGHGSPLNALEDNQFTRSWSAIGKELEGLNPAAVLCISAHWYTNGTYVHGALEPRTIHDFYGFPPELYALRYQCLGAPSLAEATQEMLHQKTQVHWDESWGLDHGAWVVLRHVFPRANIPVFQISLDVTKSSQFHFALAEELQALRERGVLIVGSGNIVHNLGLLDFSSSTPTYDWALEFDEAVVQYIVRGDYRSLVDYQKLGPAALLSIPTPEHYWPFLYALALQKKGEEVKFLTEGLVMKSISMRSFIIR